MNAEVLVRISDEEFAHQVVEVAGQVWLAMDSGAYRVEYNSRVHVLKDLLVTIVAEVEGEIWLGSEKGLFRVEGHEAVPIFKEEVGVRSITAIKSVEGIVWLGTDRGLFRIEDNTALPTVLREWIYTITVLDGQLWVGTRRNAYRIDESGVPVALFNEPMMVLKIIRAGSYHWFITSQFFDRYGPCFRSDGGRPVKFLSDYEVIFVTEVAGEVWFATTRGLLRLVQGRPQRVAVRGLKEPVNTISVLGSEVWLGTTQRAYRKLGGSFVPIPSAARDLNVKGIVMAAGRVWLWAETGAYRFDEDVELCVQPTTHSFFGLEILLGRVVRIKEARHDRRGGNPYEDSVGGDFGVILHPDLDTFNREVAKDHYIPVESLERTVSYGIQELHLMARDAYGNTVRTVSRPVLVLPGPAVAGFLLPFFWWLITLIILCAAPWSRPCMALVMAPRLRRLGSLWSIPVALSFTFVRRHLLRRYLRELLLADEFSGWVEGGGLPSTEVDIGGELARRHGLLLLGDPDVTRRYLRFLTWQLAAGKVGGQPLQKIVPIFLRIELYAEEKEDIEDGVISQLADLGGLTDPQLARTFLRLGGFIFLLDGLGRLQDHGRVVVEQFIDGYRHKNFIVVGSDHSRSSLDGLDPAIHLLSPMAL
ncbi:MAG: hypothetical protein GY835_03545 [bacterium]|nr:hypothetical protein [bacterium]